jgi:Spy/CpxP family protein refolding chaperone
MYFTARLFKFYMETLMKRTQKIVLGLVTLATIGILASSYARGMGPDGGCAMAGMEGQKMGNPDQIDSRLAMMKKNLNIGAEQETAWSAFTGTIKQQKTEMMSVMQERHANSAQATQSAPDRISEHMRLMKQRVVGMETVAAMKQLYAVLTPQQKEILDARFAKGMPM